jgi:hypothetical protein
MAAPVRLRDLERGNFNQALQVVNQQQNAYAVAPRPAVVVAERHLYDHNDIAAREALRWMQRPPPPPRPMQLQEQQLSDEYEQLLRLDENNVSRGINRETQRRVLREAPLDKAVTCLICQEEMAKGERVCFLPCDHPYHKECVSPWLERERTCPVCRKEVCSLSSAQEALQRRAQRDPSRSRLR